MNTADQLIAIGQEMGGIRGALIDREIRTREIRRAVGERETEIKAETDYKSLGSNNNERDIALAAILQADDQLTILRRDLEDAENEEAYARLDLEALIDHRRGLEWAARLRLTDALIGRVATNHAGAYNRHSNTNATDVAYDDTALRAADGVANERAFREAAGEPRARPADEDDPARFTRDVAQLYGDRGELSDVIPF